MLSAPPLVENISEPLDVAFIKNVRIYICYLIATKRCNLDDDTFVHSLFPRSSFITVMTFFSSNATTFSSNFCINRRFCNNFLRVKNKDHISRLSFHYFFVPHSPYTGESSEFFQVPRPPSYFSKFPTYSPHISSYSLHIPSYFLILLNFLPYNISS